MNAASAVAGVDLSSSVSVAVARKALDSQQAQGDQVVQMIKDAGDAGQQAQRSAAAAQRGGIDVTA
ncbi:MAG: hypothetical protein DHS20C14_05100 [Phycisphaeraceae bacterium]|nr:MAG: hypothetical protein DHS20C14_05100 [Phycisphaeraceae bacterium]